MAVVSLNPYAACEHEHIENTLAPIVFLVSMLEEPWLRKKLRSSSLQNPLQSSLGDNSQLVLVDDSSCLRVDIWPHLRTATLSPSGVQWTSIRAANS